MSATGKVGLASIGVCIILCLCASALPARAAEPPAGDTPGLVIGEFALPRKTVVDGDTIHVVGLSRSLRLLGIDTEETFKHDSERAAYQAGWASYLAKMRGVSPHPVKMATPLGEDGKQFALEFFAGVHTVRLERDQPIQIHDYYDRYLAYVFAKKNGQWVNYNVEAVRSGMSPYFTKYGYSRRFHDEFVAAEAEARAARRGIWDPTRQHYPDYAERKAWWDARAEFVKAFEAEAAHDPSFIALNDGDAGDRLARAMADGTEVVVLGAVSDLKHTTPRGPTLVLLGVHRGEDFPVVVFDARVLAASEVEKHVGEFIRARGLVTRWEDHQHRAQLQIIVRSADQIVVSAPTSTVPDLEPERDDAR